MVGRRPDVRGLAVEERDAMAEAAEAVPVRGRLELVKLCGRAVDAKAPQQQMQSSQ